MSSYKKVTKHPYTKEFEKAEWIDNYYGRRNYGVRFPSDNRVFPADKFLWEFEQNSEHICCNGECNHDDCCGKVEENCPLKNK